MWLCEISPCAAKELGRVRLEPTGLAKRCSNSCLHTCRMCFR